MDIILLEPETPGNIGAIARAMANFGFNNLILVNPKCDYLHEDCLKRAKHAKCILNNARIAQLSILHTYHTLIATTAQVGTDYNIPRSPIPPEMLPVLPENTGILFGREGEGLSNRELGLCDFVVTIPSLKEYPTLNISHAVTIILYELAKKIDKETVSSHIELAAKQEKDQLLKLVDNILETLPFSTQEKKETQRKVWKRIIGKSFLTKREAFALMGFLKKLK